MRGLIRHLVMWLLALALPWQGAAAATGLHCAHARSAVAAPAPAAHSPAHEAIHSASEHAAHHHGGSATRAHAHPTSTHSDTLSSAHDAGAAPTAQQGCSACASCCPAVAMPVAALVVSGHPKVASAPPAVFDVTVVFLTGGPDRPPRSFLA
jgi:hypothetical protein